MNVNDRNKGCNINNFVKEYVVFDLETTGINIYRDEIIEIAAIKVSDGKVIDTFSELVKPSISIPYMATQVNGITDDLVKNAETIKEPLKRFINFIGCSILVGHNINSFDLNIIYDAALKYFDIEINNDFVDTLYLSKKVLNDIDNYKLATICNYFNIDSSNAHRALADCYLVINVYSALEQHIKSKAIPTNIGSNSSKNKNYVMNNYTDETRALQTLQGFLLGIIADNILSDSEIISLKNWMDTNIKLKGNFPFDRVFNCLEKVLLDGIIEPFERDELLVSFKEFTSPNAYSQKEHCISFENSIFCLTGNFEIGTKSDVSSMIIGRNCSVSDCIKNTINYMIVGGKGSPDWKCGNYGGKIKKALEMQEKGSNIKIISEENFLEIING